MKEWLTVSEAAHLAKKSESAIKRLIYKLQKEKPTCTKKQNGKNYIKSSAITERPANEERTTSERSQSEQRTNEESEERTKIIDILTNQIEQKDKQIEALLIQSEQKNKLIAHLQNQLQIAPPANDQRTFNERPTNDQPQQQYFISVLLVIIFVVLCFVLVTVV